MSSISINDLNNDNLKPYFEKINNSADIVDNVVNDIILNNCKELDDYISYVKSILSDDNNTIPTPLLEDMTLSLPVLLYQIGEVLEKIGIKEDIAKAIKTEMFNNYVLNGQGKVTENKLVAEIETQMESISLVIYQRAYNSIKSKMDLGLQLLQSVKKILSKRITELEVSRSAN